MSNGFKWELSTWGDGNTHLVFWDSASGKDVVIRFEFGLAYHMTYDDQMNEVATEIDLVDFLEEWHADNKP